MLNTDAPVMMMPGYGNNDGLGCGGGAIWAIVLLALLGNGWNRNNGCDGNVYQANELGQIDAGVRGVQNGLCSLGYDLNNSIKDGSYNTLLALKDGNALLSNGLCQSTYEITGAINNLAGQMQQNFCQTNYNNQQNTNAIIQTIKDGFCQQNTAALQAKVAEQSQLLSEQRIVAALSGCGCGCGTCC